ncbi:hypothetical protein LTR95_000658 [Oleoguttula sp. CCFEE 5521]
MRAVLPILFAASVSALPELSIAKHSQLTSASAAKLRRRDLPAVQRPHYQATTEGKAWFEEHFPGQVGKGVIEARDAEVLSKRAGGTVETNVYDVLTWSNGGAYYANVILRGVMVRPSVLALARAWRGQALLRGVIPVMTRKATAAQTSLLGSWGHRAPPSLARLYMIFSTTSAAIMCNSNAIMSGISKDIIALSAGLLLKIMSLGLNSIGIGPLLTIDAGTTGPNKHGEVCVLHRQ